VAFLTKTYQASLPNKRFVDLLQQEKVYRHLNKLNVINSNQESAFFQINHIFSNHKKIHLKKVDFT